MGAVKLSAFLASALLFIISMHSFYQNIHALENHTTPSPSVASPSTRILKVAVPRKTVFTEFVSVEKNGTNFIFGGFCVKAFEAAIETLNYSVRYIAVGNGITEPDYDDDLIAKILRKEVDAVVGDVTITANRSHKVLFTQPFMDSGLLTVVLLNQDYISSGFDFLKPFTTGMWVLTLGFFIIGGVAIYLLERKKHPQLEGSNPSRHCGSILWFGFSTLFTNQNDIRTVLGRIVVVAWLFVIGILYSCYTANLSAILTAPRLEPTLNGIHSVVARQHIKIGIQKGSYVENYLTDNFKIDKRRLIALNTEADYYKTLFSGQVGAIIEERPCMQSMVAKHCDKLTFAGQTFTTENWGFVFHPIYEQLVKEISIRILELSDNGTLHEIQKQFLPYYNKDCSGYTQSGSDIQIHIYNFWGLYVVAGLVSVTVLLFYMVRWKWNASRTPPLTPCQGSSDHGGGLALIKRFLTPRQGSSNHGGGLALIKRFQILRRTKSLNAPERRANFNSILRELL